ncbi:hypothetical protein RCO27_18635 [Sphingosinicella sp. LHD-64]|uniref:hypothetical protein n=1 Tax=Sphingosinicella sp. LHD-64 TaxID=3072139 RepID=UPI00280E15D6|nr:hypothetical protein [Sphingosinicella sp. LHD-64]MDQ8758250.1 hypothetical protein [Sphingosinicella sp. LHD-64]
MQRVRIGLTGLAFVFLAVLLAAIFTRDPAGEAPITPNLIEHQGADQNIVVPAPQPAKPAEPLAELGVAPGNADSNTVVPVAPPAQ